MIHLILYVILTAGILTLYVICVMMHKEFRKASQEFADQKYCLQKENAKLDLDLETKRLRNKTLQNTNQQLSQDLDEVNRKLKKSYDKINILMVDLDRERKGTKK